MKEFYFKRYWNKTDNYEALTFRDGFLHRVPITISDKVILSYE